MAKKDSIDRSTGHKLRLMTREQCQTSDQIFEALAAERAEREAGSNDESVDIERLKGPARLNDAFSKL